VTSSYPAGPDDAAAPFLPPFCAELVRAGCRVTVVTPDRGGSPAPVAGCEVVCHPWSGQARPAISLSPLSPDTASLLAGSFRALAAVHRRAPLDRVLAAWAVPAGVVAALFARRAAVPYDVWALGSDINVYGRRLLTRPLVRQVLRSADRRYADGVELAEHVSRLSGRPCTYLASGRPLPAPDGPGLGDLPGAFRFLFVGRLEPVKGVDVLLAATLEAIAAGADIGLALVGGGSMAGAAGLAASGSGGRIRAVGPLPAGAIAAAMRDADCLVIPSRSESIPLVLGEALQAGLPILVTDVGDMGRLVRQHGLGDPVPAGDQRALAAAMRRVAGDSRLRAAMAAAAPPLLEMLDVRASARRYAAAI
jgi:glycosyltransferase involved in cell wall biosynthesis